ncbi:type II secretion system ATPase GspE [Deferrisoma camini]|uniref:type II secretion system ATPase GspE n=1 Tax=Deferrisoma camini TaxID=1035120 RepID=UPI0004BB589C|nr:type II secretion system ATPase GspE [Deferrisoma camini]
MSGPDILPTLEARGLLTPDEAAQVREAAAERGVSALEALRGLALADDREVSRALAEAYGLEWIGEIRTTEVPAAWVRRVPISFARRHRCLPVEEDGDRIVVAVADPTDTRVLHDLRVLFGRPLRAAVAPAAALEQAVNRVYEEGSDRAEEIMEELAEGSLEGLAQELEEPRDLLDAAEEAPVIRLVNGILFQAVKDRASDIHIEPFERELQIRYRIDGVLYPVLTPPKALQAPITSRVKVMAGLDIAEKRLPQDGRIRIKIAGKDIDIRVSVLPTAHGERVVLRLLDKSAVLLDLEQLGLEGERLEAFKSLIRKPHGILLVTGPTGSGKTTTLYAALSRINSRDVNIITVEDPIEYQLQGIGQIQVNPKIDLTFAAGLRSILRQDPDVIMVGEIRDAETAEIAIQASLTGHLVFSTLHTNDAAGAMTRLVEMGVEPFLVASSILAVLAQRLVRVLCPACREAYDPPPGALEELGLDPSFAGPLYRPVGCPECRHTGYRGRTGIYELLSVDDAVRQLVMQRANSVSIKEAGRRGGMITLREDGARKVAAGITSAEEVLRVTQDEVL